MKQDFSVAKGSGSVCEVTGPATMHVTKNERELKYMMIPVVVIDVDEVMIMVDTNNFLVRNYESRI